MPVKKSCPFCPPAVRGIAFMESAGFLAVYNIAPVLPGHSLVVPKKHCESILKLSETDMHEFFGFCRKVTIVLNNAFNTEGFDWTLQEKPEAGQTVEHMHLHIIPRFPGDLPNPGDWYPLLESINEIMPDSLKRPKHTSEEIRLIVLKLRSIVADKYPLNITG